MIKLSFHVIPCCLSYDNNVINNYLYRNIFKRMMRVDNINATKSNLFEPRMQVAGKFDWQQEWKKVADNLFKLGTSLNLLWILFLLVRRMHNVYTVLRELCNLYCSINYNSLIWPENVGTRSTWLQKWKSEFRIEPQSY